MARKRQIEILAYLETDRNTAAGITTVTYAGATMVDAIIIISTLPGPVYMVAALNGDVSDWVEVSEHSLTRALKGQDAGDPCPVWVTNRKNDPDLWETFLG